MNKLFLKRSIITLCLSFIFISCSTTRKAEKGDINPFLRRDRQQNIKIDTNEIQDKARDYVIKGSTLQMQNRFAEAILEFQEALTYDSSASIYYAIARSYKELGKFNQSIKNALNSIEQDSTFIPAYEILVDDYLVQYKVDDAINAYEQIYKLDPTKYRKFALARLYEFKNIPKAISLYNEILEEGEDVTVMDRLAELYKQNDDNDKYIATLEKIYSLSSDDSYIASMLLKGYLTNKSYQKALNFLHELDKTQPSTSVADNYAIMAGGLLEDSSKASREFIPDFLKDINDRFLSSWKINLLNGYLCMSIQDTMKAEKFFLNSNNVSDTISDVPFSVGLFYYQWKKYSKAIQIFAENEIKYPKEARFPFYIGIIYSIQDSDNLAIVPLKKALNIDSSNVEILAQLGMVYDKLKQFDSCDYYYEKGLLVSPDDPLINNNYAYTLSVRGLNLDKALWMINVAIKADSLNASYLDTYGWVQYKLGNLKLSLDYILKSIEHGGSSSEVYEHLGEIYYKMDNLPEARKAWETGLKKEPGNHVLLENMKLLK